MIYSIQILNKELKSAKTALNRNRKMYFESLIDDLQYHSIQKGLEDKIEQLESDIETLKNKYK